MEDLKEQSIRTPGGWQKVEVRERIKNWWNQLKAKGNFKPFNSYEDWEKKTYENDKEFWKKQADLKPDIKN